MERFRNMMSLDLQSMPLGITHMKTQYDDIPILIIIFDNKAFNTV